MAEAGLGSRAEAQDDLCPSQDLFSFKTTLLKNTNKTALPISSVDVFFSLLRKNHMQFLFLFVETKLEDTIA